MALIHHVVTGRGWPAIVFVHGFGCAHGDWDGQAAHFSLRYQTVAVDLRGHGASRGSAAACSVARYGADVAEVMRSIDAPRVVLVGHSMGCRVVVEAALQAPDRTVGVVLVDGSQFGIAMGAFLQERFAVPGGYVAVVDDLFGAMFTDRSDKATATSVIARARALPRAIGERMLIDLQRYDVERLTSALAGLRVPVMAVQTTFSNARRERRTMTAGQMTPYLEMLRARVPSVRIEVIPDTGHFPQLDEGMRTNGLIADFVGEISGSY